MSATTTPLLTARGIRAGFGAQTVLHGVDLDVEPGQVTGIFGLNGAGKSVTMKVLGGSVPARSGSVPTRCVASTRTGTPAR